MRKCIAEEVAEWIWSQHYLLDTKHLLFIRHRRKQGKKERACKCVAMDRDELWIFYIHLHEWWCLWNVLNMCEKRYFHGRLYHEYGFVRITWAVYIIKLRRMSLNRKRRTAKISNNKTTWAAAGFASLYDARLVCASVQKFPWEQMQSVDVH